MEEEIRVELLRSIREEADASAQAAAVAAAAESAAIKAEQEERAAIQRAVTPVVEDLVTQLEDTALAEEKAAAVEADIAQLLRDHLTAEAVVKEQAIQRAVTPVVQDLVTQLEETALGEEKAAAEEALRQAAREADTAQQLRVHLTAEAVVKEQAAAVAAAAEAAAIKAEQAEREAILGAVTPVVEDLVAQLEQTAQESAERDQKGQEEEAALSQQSARFAAEKEEQEARRKVEEEEAVIVGNVLEGMLVHVCMSLAAEAIDAAEGTVVAAEAAAMAVAQALQKLQDADALVEAQREEARMLQLQRDMVRAAEEQRKIMEAREREQAIMQDALREQQRVMQLMRHRGSLGL